ncbi:MAG: hypothetical protein LBQ84_01435 [Flavobacteriaceae bacterium]|nr:hypothetical protein [Flavobacteriaceae bacterium]
MDNQNQNRNQNQNQETDILVLLDYFKNGFKKIFTGIGDLFKSGLNIIIGFFILLKRHAILVLICVIVFTVIGYFNKIILPPSYNYEMVVQPNFNSTKSLYQLIDSYGKLAGTDDKFFKNIIQVKVAPVKSFKNDISVFYKIINDNNNDTIFSRQYKIENFRKNITALDYPSQTISIKSSSPLSTEEIKNKIIIPLETSPLYSQIKNAYLKSIDIKEKYYINNLQRIDTLLASREEDRLKTATPTLSIKGEAKNNIEEDLLKRSVELTKELAYLEIEKAVNSNVIQIVSEPQLEENKSPLIRRDTLSFAIYGFIFSIVIIFLIQFIKYLNKFEKEHF